MTQMNRDIPIPRRRHHQRRRTAHALAALSLLIPCGCTREFFRNWANQDATEAIFEKSRDPRWRLDMFSAEPPAFSRFASPFDPDFPPAPPDDLPTEALSPVPQWPKVRLMTPAEGTGYLDMLEAYKNDRPAAEIEKRRKDLEERRREAEQEQIEKAQRAAAERARAAEADQPPSDLPIPLRPERPRMDDASPDQSMRSNSRAKSGTAVAQSTPSRLGPRSAPVQAKSGAQPAGKDPSLLLTSAYQETNIPPPAITPPRRQASSRDDDPERPTPVPNDPDPQIDIRDVDTAPGLGAGGSGTAEEDALKRILTAPVRWGYEEELEAAGLPKDSDPYKIGPRESLELALINSRVYQFRLEGVLLAALPVTLQRFAFEPQGYAGLGSATAVGGAGLTGVLGSVGPTIPPGAGVNQWVYRTKEAPGGQLSQLNLGTLAGFGKLFNNGLRVAGGIANTTIFQFTGNNSRQPTVQSLLPLTVTMPFLRGGGRAVTLEPLTQAERNLLYEIRNFARFRQEFFTSIMTIQGQGITSASTQGGVNVTDTAVGYLTVVQNLQEVENDVRNVEIFERVLRIYQGLASGAGTSVSSLDVDQIDLNLQSQKQTLLQDQIQYRNLLDQYKIQLGMPPDVNLMADYGVLSQFSKVFQSTFGLTATREQVERLVSDLPGLPDVIIDGRSVIEATKDPEKLEDLMLAAERVALENRLDLMNQRAQLYDAWRQIRVTSNALQGIFNVTLTNQVFTPPTTSNPFAFLDQSRQFSLVFNGELPLVRLNERNTFRTALVNYERQRRSLMAAEDTIKFQVRNEIRTMIQNYVSYELLKRNFISTVRAADLSLQQILGPQQAGAGGAGGGGSGGTQTQLYAQNQSRIVSVQNQILGVWVTYQAQRLILHRDLGTMPYDEWEAFYELFPAATDVIDRTPARSGPGSAAAPEAGG
ncbi:MAG: hypothetical protein U0800_04300 [Isosphaeraceae bacterium]